MATEFSHAQRLVEQKTPAQPMLGIEMRSIHKLFQAKMA
jgi:hypothetical protein